MDKCKTCIYWSRADGARGFCFLEPPKLVLMPVWVDIKTGAVAKPSNVQTGQIQERLLPNSIRPLTTETDFCASQRDFVAR